MTILFDTIKKRTYDMLDTTGHIVDIQGWMNDRFSDVFEKTLDTINANKERTVRIIEVGSWKGLSANTMANICKTKDIQCEIYAVDTWLGSSEHWDDNLSVVERINGYPKLYFTFIKNMKELGHENTVVPIPLTSIGASEVLEKYNVQADIIYLDASHDYDSVKIDIDKYWPLLKKGGVMMGDDYHPIWNGVMKAVNERFNNIKRVEGNVWYVTK